MPNYDIQVDEVVLFKGDVMSKNYKGNLQLTLTSKKIIIEKEKGLFKKEHELLDVILLDDVKLYNGAAQIKQKGGTVEIQTTAQNLVLEFSGMIEARKFTGKCVDAVTGTTLTQRNSEKVKAAINTVDETLGIDTRSTIKGVIENGVTNAIFGGIKRKK